MAPRPDRPKGERPRRPFSRPDGPARGATSRPERPVRLGRSDRQDRSKSYESPERAERSDRYRTNRSERLRSERPSFDRTSFDRTSFGRSTSDRSRSDRSRAGQTRFERTPLERTPLERTSFDRTSSERRSSERRNLDRRSDSRPDQDFEPTADSNTSPEIDDLVWGRHAAMAALESGRPIHRIWCTPEMRFSSRFLQLLREAKGSGVLVEEVTWARLAQLSGAAVHQGIVLQTAAAETLNLKTLVEGCSQLGEAPLLMAVDGLTDPQNLGAIVRSAEALGAHGLVLPQRRSAGLTGSVAKVAAGALEHLPIARVVNLNRALESLKENGYRVVGLAEEGSVPLMDADLEGPLVVVTGSEGNGLSMLTRRHCDQLVRIPLRGVTPNLNAAVATALLLYELARRGWMAGIHGQDPAPRLQRVQLKSSPSVAVETPNEEQISDGFSAEIRL
ncbi:MAG: 23S rRNA (guanosine(2251)-2'-O)-methyltransferase RlmB [Synechococcaceae bacterium LLD_019]|nr:23S rRNA (guanosine(2251)-2'-O)-methyltransferase RlmB [Synechococcaceae bacterium WB6_1B_055]NBP98287.1 23S rRNA (guanosine(2251)-2'-O)-methyltransferase RlmB [Synechococcaceae bacterium WB6_3A_227]NBY59211.1 23S rRNA (guanosine(2251)-2'-O)-methyltransferase RlmB [Synechococcaceae bacterium LLD_019]NDC06034.1 23S rRNA (guanosine(2251)-2'-O)-methyltransferase RlmB [Synechococcaceae bacterium WB9_2_069]